MKFPRLTIAALLMTASVPLLRAQQWTTPTQDELKMTSIAAVPGADAVMLNHEETDDDDLHVQHHYFRIKVLTEKGLKYADVDIDYDKRTDGGGFGIGEFYGRTVQPDGTIVPFTGKGMDKVMEKDKENAFSRRVYSLPAVHVGSIVEYRYTIRRDDHWFAPPRWYMQGDLYVKNEKFLWKPTDKELLSTRRGGRESVSQRLTWAASLPPNVTVENRRLPTGRMNLAVSASDIMPFANEQYMPPIYSSRYHVYFYYTPYYNAQDYWTTEVKYWVSDTEKFEHSGGLVASTAQEQVAGATTEEQKARKLYAFAMTLENTDYTRQRTTQEEKSEIKNAEDVLRRKHGSSDQIAMTYVALARAVGLKAQSMYVSDRSRLIFDVNWQEISQLQDVIAIVNYGGTDHFLDPGSRYMPYGHLEWDHTVVGGVREDAKDKKADMFVLTPGDSFKFSHTSRVGDLKLSETGHMDGKLTFTYDGSPALRWRHVALRNDTAELKDQMKKQLESMLPAGTDVEITDIANVDNGELPLKVQAKVSGQIGNSAGSRVMLPSVLFEHRSSVTFPHERRQQAVYFPYNESIQDAVRYVLPAGWTVESAPSGEPLRMRKTAAYSLVSQQAANTITLRRDLVLGDIYYPLDEYAELRTFYNDLEAKDHSNVVLKRTTTTASAATPTGD